MQLYPNMSNVFSSLCLHFITVVRYCLFLSWVYYYPKIC